MKFDGFKTVAYGLAVAILPAAIQYIGSIDVASVFGLSPAAGAIVGAGILALRAVTNSPIFQK